MRVSHQDIAENAIRCRGLSRACACFADNSVAALLDAPGAVAPWAGLQDERGSAAVVGRKPFSKSHLNFPFFHDRGKEPYTIEVRLRSYRPDQSNLHKA